MHSYDICSFQAVGIPTETRRLKDQFASILSLETVLFRTVKGSSSVILYYVLYSVWWNSALLKFAISYIHLKPYKTLKLTIKLTNTTAVSVSLDNHKSACPTGTMVCVTVCCSLSMSHFTIAAIEKFRLTVRHITPSTECIVSCICLVPHLLSVVTAVPTLCCGGVTDRLEISSCWWWWRLSLQLQAVLWWEAGRGGGGRPTLPAELALAKQNTQEN
jgi:hypothetical protein